MADVGRPTLYKPEYAEKTRELCQAGATDADLAEFFGVSIRTISNWRDAHPEFLRALKVGKSDADDRVERSYYQRAVGYTFEAVKIFMPAGAEAPVYAPYLEHVPPDTGAAFNWLKNRRRDEWRDKQEVEHTGRVVSAIESVIVDPKASDPHSEGVRPSAEAEPL